MLVNHNTRLWQMLTQRNTELEEKKISENFLVRSIYIMSRRSIDQDVVVELFEQSQNKLLKLTGIRQDIAWILKEALGVERYSINHAVSYTKQQLVEAFNTKYGVELNPDDLDIDNPDRGVVKLTYKDLNPSYYGWFVVSDPLYAYPTDPGGENGYNGTWNTVEW